MKKVYSQKDIEDYIRQGRSAKDLPEDAILTPSARDALNDLELSGNGRATGSLTAAPAKPLSSKSRESGPPTYRERFQEFKDQHGLRSNEFAPRHGSPRKVSRRVRCNSPVQRECSTAELNRL